MRIVSLLCVAFFALPAAPALAETGLCVNPSKVCGAKLPASCLTRLGAGAIAASETPTELGCPAALVAYRDCLASVSEQCGGAPQDRALEAEAPKAQGDRGGDWVRQFDGRVGKIAIANPTLYPFQITLWHPDNQQVFGRWTVQGPGEVHLLYNDETFSIGNDWGLQFGDSPARSVGESTQWKDGQWNASPNRFFE